MAPGVRQSESNHETTLQVLVLVQQYDVSFIVESFEPQLTYRKSRR